MIKLGGPVLGDEELQAVARVLASGQLVQAAEVAAFESELSMYLGKPTIAVSSGTAALHLSLLALGVGVGDRVIVPTYSFPATANVVEAVGAKPVFVDIDENSFNIDVDALAQTLDQLCRQDRSRKQIAAVIVVHAFGAIGDMERIAALCRHHDVPLIEDAACALGSTLGGKQPGSWGDLSCFSFHPRKLLTTAEGGAVICPSPERADKVKALRNHGLASRSDRVDFVLPGLNYRMSEVHAAIGRCQLARLDRVVEQRQAQAAIYSDLVRPLGIRPQAVHSDCRHNVQSYVVQLPKTKESHLEPLILAMRNRGIEINVGTWHIPLTAYYRERYGYSEGDFPATDRVFARSLTLPLTSTMKTEEHRQVVDTLVASIDELYKAAPGARLVATTTSVKEKSA